MLSSKHVSNHHIPGRSPNTSEDLTFPLDMAESILAKARTLDETTGRCLDVRDLMQDEAAILDNRVGPPEKGERLSQGGLLELANSLGISRESLLQVLSLPRLSQYGELVKIAQLADSIDPKTLLENLGNIALKELESRPFLQQLNGEPSGFKYRLTIDHCNTMVIGEGSELSAMRQIFSGDTVVYKSDWIRAKIDERGNKICYVCNPTALRLLAPIFKQCGFQIVRLYFIPPSNDVLASKDQNEVLVTDESSDDEGGTFSLDVTQAILDKAEVLDAAAAHRKVEEKILLRDTGDRAELDREALYEEADKLQVSRESVRQVLSLLHLSLQEQRMDSAELTDAVEGEIFFNELDTMVLNSLRRKFGESRVFESRVSNLFGSTKLYFGEPRTPTIGERILRYLLTPFNGANNTYLNTWIKVYYGDEEDKECHIYRKEVLALFSPFFKSKGFKVIFEPK